MLRTVRLQPLKAFDSSLSRASAFKTLYGFNWSDSRLVGMNVVERTSKTCFCLMLSPCWSFAIHCMLHVESMRGSDDSPARLLNQTVECANVFRFSPIPFWRCFSQFSFPLFFASLFRRRSCWCGKRIKTKHSSAFRTLLGMKLWKCAMSKHKQHMVALFYGTHSLLS